MIILKNTYKLIYVDLTYKCQMHCNFCYQGNIKKPDMKLDFFEDICKQLPSRITFRFVGGEPTLHPHFFDFIRIARKYKHFPTFSTNGLKFLEDDFCKEAKREHVLAGISLNGGLYNENAYNIIDGSKNVCHLKRTALYNMLKYDIREMILSALIMKGVNESTIKELIDFALANHRNIRHLKFRSTANIGRYIKTEPYSLLMLEKIVKHYLPKDARLHYFQLSEKCHGCCLRFRYKNLKITIVPFAQKQVLECPIRGKLLPSGELVNWFEDMVKNGMANKKN